MCTKSFLKNVLVGVLLCLLNSVDAKAGVGTNSSDVLLNDKCNYPSWGKDPRLEPLCQAVRSASKGKLNSFRSAFDKRVRNKYGNSETMAFFRAKTLNFKFFQLRARQMAPDEYAIIFYGKGTAGEFEKILSGNESCSQVDGPESHSTYCYILDVLF